MEERKIMKSEKELLKKVPYLSINTKSYTFTLSAKDGKRSGISGITFVRMGSEISIIPSAIDKALAKAHTGYFRNVHLLNVAQQYCDDFRGMIYYPVTVEEDGTYTVDFAHYAKTPSGLWMLSQSA